MNLIKLEKCHEKETYHPPADTERSMYRVNASGLPFSSPNCR